MNVIEMTLKIDFIPNGVLPESTLPDFPFSAASSACRRLGIEFRKGTGEASFE